MSFVLDASRLERAYQTALAALLAERHPDGYWIGELSTSALSTAVAVCALALVQKATAVHGSFTPLIENVPPVLRMRTGGVYLSPVGGHWRDLLRWNTTPEVHPHTAEDLERITVPTLWIAGDDDPFFELDQLVTMKRRIPGAELLIVNHAVHSVHGSHPHIVGPAIMDFLTRVDEQRRQ